MSVVLILLILCYINKLVLSFQLEDQLVEMESRLRQCSTCIWESRCVKKTYSSAGLLRMLAYTYIFRIERTLIVALQCVVEFCLISALAYRNAKAYEKARDTYERAAETHYKNHAYPLPIIVLIPSSFCIKYRLWHIVHYLYYRHVTLT